jgi:hypothetical protein
MMLTIIVVDTIPPTDIDPENWTNKVVFQPQLVMLVLGMVYNLSRDFTRTYRVETDNL